MTDRATDTAVTDPGAAGPLELHPRVSVSGISTITWSLAQDLAFWRSSGVSRVGVATHKLAAHGLEAAADDLAAAGIGVSNIVGSGGFHVDRPEMWDDERA